MGGNHHIFLENGLCSCYKSFAVISVFYLTYTIWLFLFIDTSKVKSISSVNAIFLKSFSLNESWSRWDRVFLFRLIGAVFRLDFILLNAFKFNSFRTILFTLSLFTLSLDAIFFFEINGSQVGHLGMQLNHSLYRYLLVLRLSAVGGYQKYAHRIQF